MNIPNPPTFDQLRRRWGGTLVPPGDRVLETRRIVDYLTCLGFAVSTSADVFAAINHFEGEEELAAYHCNEGIAVSHASDGWWLLFPTGDLTMVGVVDMGQRPAPQREDRPC